MATDVVLTGTGVPHPRPGTAGAGTLVRWTDGARRVALQFDAGRATVLRLMDAGTPPAELTAVFLTHLHSDHVVGLPDLALTHWVQRPMSGAGPLVIVAPAGPTVRFVERMLDAYDDDMAVRREHVGGDPIELDVRAFPAAFEPVEVWNDGAVRVEAVAVHHEPVPDAVAYRVTTPDGVVVISGDTRVCAEVEALAAGCDVLVHEACRTTPLAEAIAGTIYETIFSYHADTLPLGALAERAGVSHVLLTHLIPPPDTDADREQFAADLRAGGYTGTITVGTDLATVTL